MSEFVEVGIFFALFSLSVVLLGTYMANIFDGKKYRVLFPLQCLERWTYRACRIDPNEDMDWKTYLKALFFLNSIGFLLLFIFELLQKYLPLNPQNFPGVEWSLAFNTAISFVTNTNWQAYAGESTLGYFVPLFGLTVQNFLSAATGNAVLLALIRGLKRKNQTGIGNFWQDITRTCVYLLLPLSIIFAVFLVSQGMPQNIKPYISVTTVEGENQIIPMGPVASQVAIKQLGTNGGGFFGVNSTHPFENPTPLSNFFETFAIFCIPASAVYMFGKQIGSTRQAMILLFSMIFLWIAGLLIASFFQTSKNPFLPIEPILEGMETRFGTVRSVLWETLTTDTSNGSVNCMHESLAPITGGVALFNLMIGEVIFGGVGVGLCGMLMFVLLTVFLSGLMVGRTPEYLGKKIEKNEILWVMLAILVPCALILVGSAFGCSIQCSLNSLNNKGPHGFSSILYAFSSAAGNNGSSFAGLNANTYFYNFSLGVTMLIARGAILVPSLAVAASLCQKKSIPYSASTFQTDTVLFGILLIGVIFIVAALSFFPALSLGPIIEQLLMRSGTAF